MNVAPTLFQGGLHQDGRGKLSFINDFDLSQVKRYYIIEHTDVNVIRAWQGHKKEQKWFNVISGTFKIALVQPDNWENPSVNLEVKEFILSSENNQVLHIPSNFANGFKALEENSRMIVFSNFTIAESSDDNYRFESDRWFDWE